MKSIILLVACLIVCTTSPGFAAGDYRGDERCPPPSDWSNYSDPYEPLDHKYDYPTFAKADWPGWACSYQREDGRIVQYGDSRTPQEQWLAVWGNSTDNGK
jgi:hypothetical protein